MSDIVFFGMTLYEIAWFFLIYSFLGWAIEVVFHVVSVGKIINRGFLCGPVCPIYGFGVLSVFALVNEAAAKKGISPDEMPLLTLFIAGTILATVVELIGGALLDRLFHARWWDYSKRPFNFHGYICPEFSLIWGMAITFVVRDLQGSVERISSSAIPERIGIPVLAVLYSFLAADLVVTVLSVTRLNRELEELERIRASMRTVSDGMSRVIGEGTFKAVENAQKGKDRLEKAEQRGRERLEQGRERLEQGKERLTAEAERRRKQLEERQEAILERIQRGRLFGTGRILRGVPELRHVRFGEALQLMQRRMNGTAGESSATVSELENQNTSGDMVPPEE